MTEISKTNSFDKLDTKSLELIFVLSGNPELSKVSRKLFRISHCVKTQVKYMLRNVYPKDEFIRYIFYSKYPKLARKDDIALELMNQGVDIHQDGKNSIYKRMIKHGLTRTFHTYLRMFKRGKTTFIPGTPMSLLPDIRKSKNYYKIQPLINELSVMKIIKKFELYKDSSFENFKDILEVDNIKLDLVKDCGVPEADLFVREQREIKLYRSVNKTICFQELLKLAMTNNQPKMTKYITEFKDFDDNKFAIGTGAVGSVYGWRIQVGGGNVSVVCRSNYETVKKNGFTINSDHFGNHTFTPNNVYSSAKEVVANGEEYDYVLVCTKALPNIEDPTTALKPIIKSNKTAIVLIQNGIGIEEPYAREFPGNPIISATAFIDTKQPTTGIIVHGNYTWLTFGLYTDSVLERDEEYKKCGESALKAFDKILVSGNIVSTIEERLQRSRWFKLVWNASFSPISVISGQYSANTLAKTPGTRELVKKAMIEIIKAGEAVTGGPLHDKIPSSDIPDYHIERTEIRTSTTIPSMLQDYMNKRPMEHEVILKIPIEKAKAAGVEVPILETLYELLVMNEKKNLQ
ncbi:hypothetical protein BB559_001106 [Furculomyces boomerangus]|uniref:2-dehydropantoate 2-reductase n=1 Tax=Furculomyces boomerangus TaxID=61424 RepID=A0A2T9Z369_9FUNG|nr:hypothetical protein BB559_001106 [Furculomyces boomerangus]